LETKDFQAIRVSLASPEEILSWSYGEVTKPETINYRRLRPERDGLFCEAIFGPTKDWQCYCGKYKKVRFKGITCDKCGVEVTRSSVRRERMGHIKLASPVAHIWYTRRVPSYLGLLLDISRRNMDRVLYFAQHIITRVDEQARQKELRHIEEEIEREIKRIRATYEERAAEIQQQLEDEANRIRAEQQAEYERLERERDNAVNEIMNAAAAMREYISARMGQTATDDIIFEPAEELLVGEGETFSAEHITILTKLVQEKIDEIESRVRLEQANTQMESVGQGAEFTRELEEKIERLQEEMEQEILRVQTSRDSDREELKSLQVKQFLTDARYRELREKWGHIFQAGMGAEALYEIVKNIDLNAMAKELRAEISRTHSKQVRKKAFKRLKVVEAMRRSGNRPEWMILTVLPVIPPDLRPMVQLDGGRFATSDLNDLYRRVINRNNRLKRLMELDAPDVIIRNEKRMLQEAVDSLIDNSRRGKAVSLRGKRKLKSLSDLLKGKHGRFRRNLLGKRVDYSGRSVIVVGPHLKLHQCGLPKKMALELFKPFVIHKLVEYSHAPNVKSAKRIIEQLRPEVWDVLEEVIQGRKVLLNRAPTLHRLGIQAFEPILVEGDAIQLHPLVCAAFNADFDGDQMAVHVPLSKVAQKEAEDLMLSSQNLLLPANGEPIVGPAKDMVLGCYYLTMMEEGRRGEGRVFANTDEVLLAYELKQVDLHAKIKVNMLPTPRSRKYRLVETTPGRVIFNEIVPPALGFINELLDKGKLRDMIARCYEQVGVETTAEFADAIKAIGFRYATQSGITIAIEDITIPSEKRKILTEVTEKVREIEGQYRRGLITGTEQYVRTVELWTKATDDISEAVAKSLDPSGGIKIMAQSGATKGGFQPIRQLAGMRGLMADPSGRIIALPIRSNFREGLTALEYFISTHGARKGLADTALRTADAGYLTRRLVDVTQDVIIHEKDCHTRKGVWVYAESARALGGSFAGQITGRVLAAPAVDEATGEIIADVGTMITPKDAEKIIKAGITKVYVRSPLSCQLHKGICQLCYGQDLARGGLIQIGEAVGIIAAQSIGEPGTQLTLRTFHTGGVAGETDITQGLPRVQELFEARSPKGEALIAEIEGVVQFEHTDEETILRIVNSHMREDRYTVPETYEILVEDDQLVEAGTVLAQLGEEQIVAKHSGNVRQEGQDLVVFYEETESWEHQVLPTMRLRVKEGQVVKAGDQLTEGAKNAHDILRIQGREAAQAYLVSEVQKVYRSQGVNIHDKHIEIVVRQMLRRVRVRQSGDTDLLSGELVDRLVFEEMNERIIAKGGQPATAEPVLLGITKAALNTESFLSASSFQHTINVLAGAAIEGKVDDLNGLKENVIIGKLIPAGTGFRERLEKEKAKAEALGGDGADRFQEISEDGKLVISSGGLGTPVTSVALTALDDESIERLVVDDVEPGDGEDGDDLPVTDDGEEVFLAEMDADDVEGFDDGEEESLEVLAEADLDMDLEIPGIPDDEEEDELDIEVGFDDLDDDELED
jgi:DNA-directed RNA polymerase subunit beta'